MNSKIIPKGRDVVPVSSDLKEIVVQINDAHAEAERSLRASVEYAIRAGELLIKAKQSIQHGTWGEWLQANIAFSKRLAQTYMRLARMPVEKRNAVADLPLREALSKISSREKKRAIAAEGMSQLPPGPAMVTFQAEDEQFKSVPAPLALGSPTPQPSPPKPEEIADDLIRQLSQTHCEVQDWVTAADLGAAFARHVGDAVPAKDPPARVHDRLIEAWDKACPKQRHDFVLARKVEIMRAQQTIGKHAHEPDDDGLDIPDYLRRVPKEAVAS
jgi:hypothetical protein